MPLRALLPFICLFLLSVAAVFAAVNINTADEKTLATLPGIGPVKAIAIVEHRGQHGGFKSVDELKAVKGIGAKTVEKLRGQVIVDE